MRKTVLRSACIALLVGIGLALPGVAKAAPPPCGPKKILIVYADSDGTPDQLVTALQGEADVTSVNLFDAASATPTLNDLNPYNLVLTCSNSPYADADGLGNVLADYQDSGVGLVVPTGIQLLRAWAALRPKRTLVQRELFAVHVLDRCSTARP